jgi:hypothetical protein
LNDLFSFTFLIFMKRHFSPSFRRQPLAIADYFASHFRCFFSRLFSSPSCRRHISLADGFHYAIRFHFRRASYDSARLAFDIFTLPQILRLRHSHIFADFRHALPLMDESFIFAIETLAPAFDGQLVFFRLRCAGWLPAGLRRLHLRHAASWPAATVAIIVFARWLMAGFSPFSFADGRHD